MEVNLVLAQNQPIYHFFHQLTSEDALAADSYNYYVHQDTDGFVWISSLSGLHRFDGRRTRLYTPDTSEHSLPVLSASMSRFWEDRTGGIWFTTGASVSRYDPYRDHFENYQVRSHLNPNTFFQNSYSWCYLDTLVDRLWVRVSNELYSSSITNPAEFVRVDSFAPTIKAQMVPWRNQQYRLYSFNQNTLDIRTYDGVNGQLREAKQLEGPAGLTIMDMCLTSAMDLWLATRQGLYHLDLNEKVWQHYPVYWEDKVIDNFVQIEQTTSNQLLIATEASGLFFFNIKDKSHSSRIDRIKDQRITAFTPRVDRLTIDQLGYVWISTRSEGIFYTHFDKQKFDQWVLTDDPHAAVYDLSIDREGHLMVLLKDQLIRVLPGGIRRYYIPTNRASLQLPQHVFQDRKNRIWVGAQSELFLLKPGEDQLRPFQKAPKLKTKVVTFKNIIQLSNGDLLVGTNHFPILRIKEDLSKVTLEVKTPKESVFSKRIGQHLFFGADDSALELFEEKDGMLYPVTTLLGIKSVNDLVQASAPNTYWVASDEGLFYLENLRPSQWMWKAINQFGQINVNSLLLDRYDQLWLGTPKGLICYGIPDSTWVSFNVTDGLLNRFFYNNTSVQLEDGTLLLGGANGLTRFRSVSSESHIPPARPTIVNILVNQAPLNVTHSEGVVAMHPSKIRAITLPFEENNLEIHLSAKVYSDAASAGFLYQLLGSTDTTKIKWNETTLPLSNLSDGNYTLKIWATNGDGLLSVDSHDLAITILPPWYRTWWFYGIMAFGIASIGFGINNYRLRMIGRRKQAELEAEKAKTKVAVLNEQKALIEQEKALSEIAVLRLQMNPHFIFNSLNSIDSYILKKSPLEAHDYLIRFSQLMRSILEKSEDQLCTVSEEIKLLQGYLDLERIRFGDQLEYKIMRPTALDPEVWKIPTMVLQPFVENAIVHGLSSKKKGGLIQIDFRIREREKQLIVLIKDNGVGRAQTSIRHRDYASKSTKITERRLQVLVKSLKLEVIPEFRILDETDEKGQSLGTTVQFFFPAFHEII